MPEIESEEIWRCTTCGKCPQTCPRGVETIEVGVSLRRIASEAGISPASLHTIAVSLGAEGNPLGEERAKRADWAEGLSVKAFTDGTATLYFPCCYLSYEPRLGKVAAATVNILNRTGEDFGILGSASSCCGESIRKTGDEELFKRLARENIRASIDNGV